MMRPNDHDGSTDGGSTEDEMPTTPQARRGARSAPAERPVESTEDGGTIHLPIGPMLSWPEVREEAAGVLSSMLEGALVRLEERQRVIEPLNRAEIKARYPRARGRIVAEHGFTSNRGWECSPGCTVHEQAPPATTHLPPATSH